MFSGASELSCEISETCSKTQSFSPLPSRQVLSFYFEEFSRAFANESEKY